MGSTLQGIYTGPVVVLGYFLGGTPTTPAKTKKSHPPPLFLKNVLVVALVASPIKKKKKIRPKPLEAWGEAASDL